ncbi:BNR repeat-containing protein [Subtercola endophyticus]|uniref:BNR repeat-containing protein n=1 Tax=Subtercola endophyticus TaxID=2895559 RepID=UPI001E575536|nr:BNR repeat-containing protein [Subtercola endophyticus]UFS57845.1 BNR repeat-containing protein [Subtercola endophyticus]
MVDQSQVGTTWSGDYVQQALVTDHEDQYVGYYNSDRRMTIAHRKVGETTWRTYSIPGPMAVTGWDSHDYIALAVDSTGELHVSGNMHASPLAYWVTTVTGDVTSLINVPVLVDHGIESHVTYPTFLHTANNDLVFSYRQGGSGDGDAYLDAYNVKTKTWSPLLSTALFDGTSSSPKRSAYLTINPTPDDNGFFDVTWVWRRTGDIVTNSRLSFMRSRDLVHWQTIAGTAVSLPVTYGTAGVVVDDFPENSGVFNNQEKVGVDESGSPTISYSKFDSSGSNQLFVAHLDSSDRWSSTQITHWTGAWQFSGFGTLDAQIAVSATTALPDGNLQLSFRCSGTTSGASGVIVVDPSYRVIAQVASPTPKLPTEITRLTATDPYTRVRLVYDNVGDTNYVLKWQSQGYNQDQPFLETPPPQPIVVYSFVPIDAPPSLNHHRSEEPVAAHPHVELTLSVPIGLFVLLVFTIGLAIVMLLHRRKVHRK